MYISHCCCCISLSHCLSLSLSLCQLCAIHPHSSPSPRPASSFIVHLIVGPPNGIGANNPARFIHWKKEKLRESETTCEEQFRRERKRRHDDIDINGIGLLRVALVMIKVFVSLEQPLTPVGQYGSGPQSNELCSFLNSFRPTITHKLMGVMQKLSAELCPEEAVAQEVFEKCTAIKTCLETLEKLHSFMTY